MKNFLFIAIFAFVMCCMACTNSAPTTFGNGTEDTTMVDSTNDSTVIDTTVIDTAVVDTVDTVVAE